MAQAPAGWLDKLFLFGSGANESETGPDMDSADSVAVVIPTFNMAWCIRRAIASCQIQSMAVGEIIVVDDGSTDDTAEIVPELALRDPRIRYVRQAGNKGHLTALGVGVQLARSRWIALLDADDELTPYSIEARVSAATRYRDQTGEAPGLVYGDHKDRAPFKSLSGHCFTYLCRELCLCQTSTIMLSGESRALFPVEFENHFTQNSDDEIVLSVARKFPVVHCGAEVAIYHEHRSPSRMVNNPWKRFEGVWHLVRVHAGDVLQTQGLGRLMLWYLRILLAFLQYQRSISDALLARARASLWGRIRRLALRSYRAGVLALIKFLRPRLKRHFEFMYF